MRNFSKRFLAILCITAMVAACGCNEQPTEKITQEETMTSTETKTTEQETQETVSQEPDSTEAESASGAETTPEEGSKSEGIDLPIDVF